MPARESHFDSILTEQACWCVYVCVCLEYTDGTFFVSSQFQDQTSCQVLFAPLQSGRAGNEEIEDKSYQE